MGRMPHQPNLFVAVTKTNSIWLINKDGSDCSLSATELFGFNTGTYAEVPSGQAKRKRSVFLKGVKFTTF